MSDSDLHGLTVDSLEKGHDSIIFQATDLFQKITTGKVIPDTSKYIIDFENPSILIDGGAFLFRKWLMKPFIRCCPK